MKRFALAALFVCACVSVSACTAAGPGTGAAGDGTGAVATSTVATPDLRGLAKSEAESALTGAGLSLGAVTESYDASAAAGTVASQVPAAGTEAPQGSAVAIVLSKGPESVAVPTVKGKTQAQATTLLEALGLKVKVAKKGDRAKKGTVIAQKPTGGNAKPGATVTITVSTGVVIPRTIHTYPTRVTLLGTVQMAKFESEAWDSDNGWVRVPVLVLDEPVNVAKDENAGPENGVRRMQLVVNTDYDAFKAKYVGHKVSITGTVFFADNANHYTEVLLIITSIRKR